MRLADALRISRQQVLEYFTSMSPASPQEDLSSLSLTQLAQQIDRCLQDEDCNGALCRCEVLRQRVDGRLEDEIIVDIKYAIALQSLGSLSKAREIIEATICRASRVPQLQAEAYVVQSYVLRSLGLFDPLALDAATRGLDLAGNDATKMRALMAKGAALFSSKRFSEAIRSYKDASKLTPTLDDQMFHLPAFEWEAKINGSIAGCYEEIFRIRSSGVRKKTPSGFGFRSVARKLYIETVALVRERSPRLEARYLLNLVEIEFATGEFGNCENCLQQAAFLRHDDPVSAFRILFWKQRVRDAKGKTTSPELRQQLANAALSIKHYATVQELEEFLGSRDSEGAERRSPK